MQFPHWSEKLKRASEAAPLWGAGTLPGSLCVPSGCRAKKACSFGCSRLRLENAKSGRVCWCANLFLRWTQMKRMFSFPFLFLFQVFGIFVVVACSDVQHRAESWVFYFIFLLFGCRGHFSFYKGTWEKMCLKQKDCYLIWTFAVVCF